MLKSMTLDEKIGQLFMVTCIIDRIENATLIAKKNYPTDPISVKSFINKYHIGGVIYLGVGTIQPQLELTNALQHMSKIPLLISQDFEWGLTMRLRDAIRFPRAMTLGALSEQDDDLIYHMSAEIARQCKLLGVHLNFAPVVDVNNNPNNPVINDRSFGQDKYAVTRKSIAYMQGLQDHGIIACAKHFPGHGDTDLDSHYDLPRISHTKERLHEIELYPFKHIISAGVGSIMTAHLEIPALESIKNMPSSLSHSIVTDILQTELGFKGLIITDALDMDGVTKHFKPGEIELKALLAGNDILLCPMDVPAAYTLIKQAIKDGKFTVQELDKRVLKILQAKEWAFKARTIITSNTVAASDFFTSDARALKEKAYQQAITVIPAKSNLISLQLNSIKHECTIPLITVSNQKKDHVFEITLKEHLPVASYHLPALADEKTINQLADMIILVDDTRHKELVIVGIFDMVRSAKLNFGINQSTLDLIKLLKSAGKKVIVVVFGNAYSLKFFDDETVVLAYEDDSDAQKAAAQVLAHKIKANGKLPVTAKA
jgi:beta-glucosidase-like glycosyl hydrolase